MPPVTAGEVRSYLAKVDEGQPPSGSPEVLQLLVSQGAIAKPPAPPGLTPIGKHVLAELAVRASRTDPLPIDIVASELAATTAELDAVAKSAEYFLAELGALTPAEAAPFLRVVAAGLANRRETAEELAERFRNVWGMVEVMGGDARDRLLAAELLAASPEIATRVYPNLVQTSARIREQFGGKTASVGLAAILHLVPSATPEAPFEEWVNHREEIGADEAAAWVAGLVQRDPAAWARFRSRREELSAKYLGARGLPLAAALLAELGAVGEATAAEVPALAESLGTGVPLPVLSATLLLSRHALSASELTDWVRKAERIALQRQLAPTALERAALAVALVHGLPASRFGGATGSRERAASFTSTLLVLHSGIYRSILAGRATSPQPAPVG
ncbi:MAG: hypothetical protein L3K07_07490 [Thermoplasmata archaeon]|nr:hypothetical protein [Thermoplasmata archaeon]